jgi:fatty-acyl-CoA synthase
MQGLMMDYPLTLTPILERARLLFGHKEIVTKGAVGTHRYTYGDFYQRTCRLANVLRHLGVGPGDRVATLAWNTHTHLELYFAAPCSGAVLHTLNLRLPPDQIAYIAGHAQDSILFVDQSVLPLVAKLCPHLPSVRQIIVMNEERESTYPIPVLQYEKLLAGADPIYEWPVLDENTAAAMCYTSGTTGKPKGVLYSHRSLFLHSMALNLGDVFGATERDAIMPIVPMFHVNAWGTPFSSTMIGAKMVLPGPNMNSDALLSLIETERVTIAAGVPTIWIGMLTALDQKKYDLSSLRIAVSGGAPIPPSVVAAFQEKHGISVCNAWGMTETTPLGTMSRLRSHMDGWTEQQKFDTLVMQGAPPPGVEIRAVDVEGNIVPWDGKSIGELQVRGPWVIREYYSEPSSSEYFADGWFRTGDVVAITPDGFMRIVDRTRDLIKSGGEWISSVELESAIMAHPDVLEAAVIAVPHEKWLERPMAFVVPRPHSKELLTKEAVLEFLRPQVARWWLPDEVIVVDALPKTGTGKFDKRQLREQYQRNQLVPADGS